MEASSGDILYLLIFIVGIIGIGVIILTPMPSKKKAKEKSWLEKIDDGRHD